MTVLIRYDASQRARADAVARITGLPLAPLTETPAGERLELRVLESRLELAAPGERTGAFAAAADVGRHAKPGSALARACGVGLGKRPSVLDGMAGWGVDGLALARLGCTVTLIERSAVMAALLSDAAARIEVARCVDVRRADVRRVLDEAGVFDVVYLDPMFPARRKGALPSKRLQRLATLLGEDEPPDLEDLLARARRRARWRVVLKRRRRDARIGAPDWSIVARTVRFDVYRGAPG